VSKDKATSDLVRRSLGPIDPPHRVAAGSLSFL